jgi:hypothetical protein
VIRLGGGQGFYGDGVAPVADLLADGVDYLVCEALAELTLAILQKDRQKDESLGFTRDLPLYLKAVLPHVLEGRTRFVTNAGGINPIAAGRAVVAGARQAGLTGIKVATVVGDDVRPHAEQLGLPVDSLFANAYLGARPIVDALEQGADIVVTGRVADASLFLAPSSTSTAGPGTTGTGWPRAWPSATCSSAAAKSPVATTRGRGGRTPTPSASASPSGRSRPTAPPSSPSPRARAAW